MIKVAIEDIIDSENSLLIDNYKMNYIRSVFDSIDSGSLTKEEQIKLLKVVVFLISSSIK